MNMQPSVAEAGFDLRFPPTADPDGMRRRIAEEWAPASRNMTFEVKKNKCVLFREGGLNNETPCIKGYNMLSNL